MKRADTWRRLWPHGQRVSRKGRKAREPSCCVYRVSGETTAVNNEAQYSTEGRWCQIAVRAWDSRRCTPPGEPGQQCNAAEYTTPRSACQAFCERILRRTDQH